LSDTPNGNALLTAVKGCLLLLLVVYLPLLVLLCGTIYWFARG
jgi:hypothetical protein